MQGSRFSEEQIISFLREADGDSSVKTVYAKHNIVTRPIATGSQVWSMDVEEARLLRALEDENGHLKRLVADLSVQNQILKEVNSKKWGVLLPSVE